ncbi:MAG TPA: RNA polymerase sigma factor [Pyrinomonadaceae bacterium]
MNYLGVTQSDYELTQAIAKGGISSIGDLYVRHRPKVYAVCLQMTKNTSEAEDLTQDIFVQLLHTIGSFRGDSQFSTWLYRVTTNHVLMHFRRSSRRREKFPCVNDEGATSSKTNVSSGQQVLDRIVIDDALAKLPSGSRSVFMKFDVEGYKHEEIARILGCSVGNSKSQLHKARRKLRKLLSRGANSGSSRRVC